MGKVALITGVTGQDGSYMAELLLDKGYKVYGLIRRTSNLNLSNLSLVIENDDFRFLPGDLSDQASLLRAIDKACPDEIYNFAAQSHVHTSFDMPEYTMDVNASGTIRLLEAIRYLDSTIRLYQASSSEMFGLAPSPQSELTPFYPRSPYAVSKLAAHTATINYRESYGLKTYQGILFNHESPRRGINFVTKKICKSVAEIVKKQREFLYLGNLDAQRDWGYAPEYMEVVWKIMQGDPDTFVIGTGETHSVREFAEEAFKYVGLDYLLYVKIDETLLRPSEVYILRASIDKARKKLGWSPKVKFNRLVHVMMESEL